MKEKKISLNYNPEHLVNVKLMVNSSLFSHSVIGNLLTNAIKFSHQSSSISIDYHQEENFHVIEISDQGDGMSQEKILKLNKRSKISSSPGTSGEIGTGFGLMIVQQVIELHHGKLEFSTGVRGGTIARFFLPLVTA